MGKRGTLEEQTTRVAAMVKLSEQLTYAGIFHSCIIHHPTEGMILTGEVEMTAKVMELIENGRLRQSVNEARLRAGTMINHFSTRKIKEDMLSQIYSCVLPPLPMPLVEMRTLVLLTKAFGKVWDCELNKGGQKFKVGDPIPEKVKDWFRFGEEIWSCLRGVTHTNELAEILKGQGLTLPDFYRQLITDAYGARMRGGDVRDYHLERDYEELRRLLAGDKHIFVKRVVICISLCQTIAGEHMVQPGAGGELRVEEQMAEGQQRQDEDEQQRKAEQERLEEEQEQQRLEDVERRKVEKERLDEYLKKREGEKLENGLRKKMSVGHLKTMHREAKTFGQKTIVQVVEKHFDPNTGRLISVALSDGQCVSQKVLPLNDQAAEGMNEIRRFDLIEINGAYIKKEALILEDIDHLEVLDKKGKSHQISGPILGLEVTQLKKLNNETLKVWGEKFEVEKEVQFDCGKASPDPNETFLRADPALIEVGQSSTGQPQGQKRKLIE